MISRRQWLLRTGWSAAGLTVLGVLGWQNRPMMPSSSDPGPETGAFWLRLTGEGRLSLWAPVHELGQGTPVGLTQIAAEELRLPLSMVDVQLPNSMQLPTMRMTTGSAGIATHARPLARAAAVLREQLRAKAAQAWSLAPEAVRVEPGPLFVAPDGQQLGPRELLAGRAQVLDAQSLPDPPLYSFDPLRPKAVLGRSPPAWQAEAIVRGEPLFAADVQLPGLVHGRAMQPPHPDARLISADAEAARRVAGVVTVVVGPPHDFVGVVARTPSALERGLAALQVRWTAPDRNRLAASVKPVTSAGPVARLDTDVLQALVDVDRARSAGALRHVLADTLNDTRNDALTDSRWTLDLRCDLPALHHAQQEPRCAVARFGRRDGQDILELWLGSQDSSVSARHAAAEFGWSVDRVHLHRMRVGGAFGGRARCDVARDAWRLAWASGLPVKVQWSRADEFIADRLRPPSSHRIRLQVDAQGRLTHWWHAAVSGPMLFTDLMVPRWAQPTVNHWIADFGVTRSLLPPYRIALQRIECSVEPLPVHCGPMRSLGAGPNVFAIEVAIDEVARRLGRDPVEFRLAQLPRGSRLAHCLERIRALMADWPDPAGPPRPPRGRGVACGTYHDHSHVACGFEVEVVRDAHGEPRPQVRRIACVQDTGLVVHPDRVHAQIEGNLMLAMSQVLLEQARIGSQGPEARRLSDYPVFHQHPLPELQIELVDRPSEPPAGVGEVALIAAMPALANAIARAIGKPVRSLPWHKDVSNGL